MTAPLEIKLSSIVATGTTQMRVVGIDPETVTSYAQDMRTGATFPAVVVYHDGADYHLADGFHRVEAARQSGRETILAEVRPGTSRDAFLAACAANATHGLRRTNEDKRRAITALLTDPEFSVQSDRAIAKLCAVDHKSVGAVRRELTEPRGGEFPTKPKPNGKPSDAAGTGTSMVGKMLATISDADLLTECERRGWEVSNV